MKDSLPAIHLVRISDHFHFAKCTYLYYLHRIYMSMANNLYYNNIFEL